jgi:uncharacterized protein YbgA (DUF1722 family)
MTDQDKTQPWIRVGISSCLLGQKVRFDGGDKAELVAEIENYRKGLVPLIVPITLLSHHLRHHPAAWVLEQTYLNPYPAELMLRNHV